MGVEGWIWVSIPIVVILCGMLVVMLVVYTKHRERIAMIEKAKKLEEIYAHRPHRPENRLIGGSVTSAIGFGFLVTQWVGALTKWILLPGFILLFIGASLVLSWYIVEKTR